MCELASGRTHTVAKTAYLEELPCREPPVQTTKTPPSQSKLNSTPTFKVTYQWRSRAMRAGSRDVVKHCGRTVENDDGDGRINAGRTLELRIRIGIKRQIAITSTEPEHVLVADREILLLLLLLLGGLAAFCF